jgi:membrane-associated phospholipid phosphatase
MPGHVRMGIKKIIAGIALLSMEIIVLLVVFGLALTTFIQITKSVFADGRTDFDGIAFNFLSRYINNINTNVMEFFSFLGTHLFLIPANMVLITYFLFIKKHRWYSIKIPVVAVSSLLLMFLLKYIFRRNRPLTPLLDEVKGFSFPSGHALMSFTFYGLIIVIVWQNIENVWLKWIFTIILSLLIFVIGLSRVYLRVHYASDVLAGFCVGCMWLLLSIWILGEMETRITRI